ncbi:hypothetical protein [Mycobacterium shigaense]|uniref:Uncharacterized protein n=1 Tax=Mycobacterium shigaense TaxID=722731 RepID=A0A1Z4EE68_9MYCO|nr:hypothetical protein [Mycobacterium shigaense]MEA1121835.1 hypothetical protein [Mycobacterium shigaense]PRI16557.1 hypothetical protein B2J96_04375 [Mycobacterium shigaense]BAX91266.1 hypothetical protein MSG_01107 [Mycobacterium shigaense]
MTSYTGLTDLPRRDDRRPEYRTEVLGADARLDQTRLRTAIEAVFAAHPALGTMFEPFLDKWATRPGGAWGWAIEPPGATVADAISRQRASFDMRTGRLFAVSLLPGARDRLVLTASSLAADRAAWQQVVDDMTTAYDHGVLTRES